jgi:hypothetical protein
MLRGLLAAEGCKIGRRHMKTLMRRMGIEGCKIGRRHMKTLMRRMGIEAVWLFLQFGAPS